MRGMKSLRPLGFALLLVFVSASLAWEQTPIASQAPASQDPRLAQLTPQYRQQVLAEMPNSKTYCQQNAMLFAIFDCDCFSRMVLNYRITHPNETVQSHNISTLGQTFPTPLVNILVGDKVDCSQCISDDRITKWVTTTGGSNAAPNVIACTAHALLASLRAKPYVGEIDALYSQAVISCNK